MMAFDERGLAFSRGRSVTGAMAMVAVGVGLAGCDGGDPFEPESWDRVLAPGHVRVTLDVVPDRLRPPGEVVAALTYENLGSETVTFLTSEGCLSLASVYRGQERIPFPATEYSCNNPFGLTIHWDIPPGEPISQTWTLTVGGEEASTHLRAPTVSWRTSTRTTSISSARS